MRKILFVVALVASLASINSLYAADNTRILGSWKVDAPSAPWEYTKTTLVITEINQALTAKMVLEDKQELKVEKIEFANDILKFTLTIDGNSIEVKGKLADSTIAGSADTPDGDIKFTALKGK